MVPVVAAIAEKVSKRRTRMVLPGTMPGPLLDPLGSGCVESEILLCYRVEIVQVSGRLKRSHTTKVGGFTDLAYTIEQQWLLYLSLKAAGPQSINSDLVAR